MTDFKVKVTKAPGNAGRKEAGADVAVAWATKFRPRLWLAAGLVLAGLVFGTPHLLVTYDCYGPCRPDRASSCNYFGLGGWKANVRPIKDGCPIIRLL